MATSSARSGSASRRRGPLAGGVSSGAHISRSSCTFGLGFRFIHGVMVNDE